MRDSTKKAAITKAAIDVIAGQRVDEIELEAERSMAPSVMPRRPFSPPVQPPPDRHVVDALRQRQRHHGEVDAAGADRERADERGDRGAAEHADGDRRATTAAPKCTIAMPHA